jgi:dihydrofolate reductase
MRKVTGGPFISLDGVVEEPFKWQFDHFDEGMAAALQRVLEETDTVVLGRNTYNEWKDYWPNATTDEGFATFINNAPKYVVSTTLDSVQWGTFNNITLIKSDLAGTLKKLKRQPGKNIAVMGSPTLIRTMLQSELLDELMLTIHPVIAGKGKRLFTDGSELQRLKLASSVTTPTGVIIATYHPLTK